MALALLEILLAACGPTPEPGETPVAAVTPLAVVTDTPAHVPIAGPSACRGRIAFVARQDSQVDLFVINADGSGLIQLTEDDGYESSLSWSPDGTRILFSSSPGINQDIYSVSYDDGVITRLTEDPAQDYEPSWSPDGEQILFLSRRIPSSQVFVLSADGGEPAALTEAYAHKMDAAWSPDGKRIAFTMLDGYNQGDVYVMAADGSGLTNLTEHPAHDCCVAWSPDGERLAFLSSRDERAASNFPGATAYRYGGQLVYVGPKGEPVALPRPLTTVMPESPKDVYLIDSDGGGLTNLTSGRGSEKDHAWSPDGKWMAFVSDRDGNDEIYLLNVEQALDGGSGALIRLTDSRDDDAGPVWSPDGACLAFASFGDDSSGLYVIGVDGGGLKRLADGIYRSSALSWSP